MQSQAEATHRPHRQPKHPLQWEGYEYVHREKSADWFWVLGIVAITCIVIALIFNNIMFAVLIAIGAMVIGIFAAREPNLIQFELNERGLRIGEALFPYRTLDSYWIEERIRHQEPRLLISSKAWLNHIIVIPLTDVDPHRVHLFLEEHLPEQETREPLAHHLMEAFGF